jgi:hypothetical protein
MLRPTLSYRPYQRDGCSCGIQLRAEVASTQGLRWVLRRSLILHFALMHVYDTIFYPLLFSSITISSHLLSSCLLLSLSPIVRLLSWLYGTADAQDAQQKLQQPDSPPLGVRVQASNREEWAVIDKVLSVRGLQDHIAQYL